MRVTYQNISNAIEEQRGHANVGVDIDHDNDKATFVKTADGAPHIFSRTVEGIDRLDDYSVEQWVELFDEYVTVLPIK